MESAQSHRPRWQFSLKAALAGVILVTISTTAALVHGPWLLTSRRNIDQVIAQVNDEIARSTSQEVKALFDQALVAQETIAAAFLQELVDVNDPEQRAWLYLSWMQANPSFAWIVLGFPNGDQLGVQRVSSQRLNWIERRWLPERQRVAQTVKTFGLEAEALSPAPLSLIRTTTDEQDFRVQDRPWYQAGAAQPGQPVWTDVYVFATDRVLGINAALGLERGGEFLATVSVAFELQRISQFLQALKGDRASAIFITNPAGELIAFSELEEAAYVPGADGELRLKQVPESEHPHLSLVSQALQEQGVSFAQLTERQDLTYRSQATGELYYLSLAPLRYDGLDWFVGTVIAESLYLQDIQRNNRRLYLTVSGFLLVAAGLAVGLTSYTIGQPLLRLGRAAKAIEVGDFGAVDLQAIARRPDELGQLARVFQGMSEEVWAREQRLQQQVQDLKIEIDERQRQAQVSEIVETDFFQDLQAKARTIRRQRRDRPSGESPPLE